TTGPTSGPYQTDISGASKRQVSDRRDRGWAEGPGRSGVDTQRHVVRGRSSCRAAEGRSRSGSWRSPPLGREPAVPGGVAGRVVNVLAHQPEAGGPGEQTTGAVENRAVPAGDVAASGDVRAQSGDTGEAEAVTPVVRHGEDGHVLVP